MATSTPVTSTRPYMLRAMYEWCVDNVLTPYVVVVVDGSVRVPMEFVQNGEIVLNVSMGATSNLQIGNEYLDFKARFGGVARDISVPMGRVSAIYARENGQGMTFPVEASAANPDATQQPVPPAPVLSGVKTKASTTKLAQAQSGDDAREAPKPASTTARPALTLIK